MYSAAVSQFRIVATFDQDLISSICVPSQFESDVQAKVQHQSLN